MKIPCEDCITLPMCRLDLKLDLDMLLEKCSILSEFCKSDYPLYKCDLHKLNECFIYLISHRDINIKNTQTTSIHRTDFHIYSSSRINSEPLCKTPVYSPIKLTYEKVTCKRCLKLK